MRAVKDLTNNRVNIMEEDGTLVLSMDLHEWAWMLASATTTATESNPDRPETEETTV